MNLKIEIPFKDSHKEVHLIHPFGDHTLCGHDHAGDKDWDEGVKTDKKVTCELCILIVKFCKKINLKQTISSKKSES